MIVIINKLFRIKEYNIVCGFHLKMESMVMT